MPAYCPAIKTSCKSSSIVKSVQKLITQLESDDITDFIPVTSKELNMTKKALRLYLSECSTCARHTANDHICLSAAIENLQRRIPMFAKNVYPWKNYDWNYSNHISNNYTPKYTGATIRPSIMGLYNNVKALNKVFNGLISDPIPNKNSRAGKYNRDSDHPSFEECKDHRCITTQRIKNAMSDNIYNPPTTDKFLKKKLDGEYSSSYFVKIGSCPRHDISSQKICEARGYSWTPNVMDNIMNKLSGKKNVVKNSSGSCNQPRYLFIDNSPKAFLNGSNMKGILPSLANDIAALAPDKFLAAAMGNSMSGNFDIQQCPDTRESFSNYNNKTNTLSIVCIILLILLYCAYY